MCLSQVAHLGFLGLPLWPSQMVGNEVLTTVPSEAMTESKTMFLKPSNQLLLMLQYPPGMRVFHTEVSSLTAASVLSLCAGQPGS